MSLLGQRPDVGEFTRTVYATPSYISTLETSTAIGKTLVPLVKEIGTDATFALLRKLQGEGVREEAASGVMRRLTDTASVQQVQYGTGQLHPADRFAALLPGESARLWLPMLGALE